METVVFGVHAVHRLLTEHPEHVLELIVKPRPVNHHLTELIRQTISQHPQIVFRRFSKSDETQWSTVVHRGVIARCRVVSESNQLSETALLERLEQQSTDRLVLILDSVTDPHNLGACLRTAAAAAVDGVVACCHGAVGLTPSVRKVASGAAETVPFVQANNLVQTITSLKALGFWVYGTALAADETLFQTGFTGSVALVIGSEDKGLRPLVKKHCDRLIHIPMSGQIQSLNLSVAAGICLFEIQRQRLQATENTR